MYGVGVEIALLHFEEGCFEEIHIGVDLFLLSLVEALALLGCFVGGGVVDVAEELRHLDEVPTGLPVLPADLASREESSVIKGEKEETFAVLLQKPSFGVESSFLPLLLYLQTMLPTLDHSL